MYDYVCYLLQSGGYSEDMIPTVGFNMRKVTKGNVTIKLWDLGGQPRFRSMWERYCRGVSAIVYALYLLSRMLVYLILFKPVFFFNLISIIAYANL
ncbi:hypothetical protein BHM03_00013094 [Ensete ventricosum]|nr:hypothetical protein BHM03_00013094 [Ensete ventricosum]